jgi:flagellar motor switch protein FliG
LDRATNLERFKDQLRSSIIQAVKGVADVGIAYVRYVASEDKREADMLEAAKNTTDRSANAMSESGRKAAEDVKKLLQTFDSILQMMDSSIKKQFS